MPVLAPVSGLAISATEADAPGAHPWNRLGSGNRASGKCRPGTRSLARPISSPVLRSLPYRMTSGPPGSAAEMSDPRRIPGVLPVKEAQDAVSDLRPQH